MLPLHRYAAVKNVLRFVILMCIRTALETGSVKKAVFAMYSLELAVDVLGQATLCFPAIRQSITDLIIPWFKAHVNVQSKGKQAIGRL